MKVSKFEVLNTEEYACFNNVKNITWSDGENILDIEFIDSNNSYLDLLDIIESKAKLNITVKVYELIRAKNKLARTYFIELFAIKVTQSQLTSDTNTDTTLLVKFKIMKSIITFESTSTKD